MHHHRHLAVLLPFLALPTSSQARLYPDSDEAGPGISQASLANAEQLARCLSAAILPNATGHASPSYVYLEEPSQTVQTMPVDPYNETDPYAHALSLNVSNIKTDDTFYQDVRVVNRVFELTLSEFNVRRLVALNRTLHMWLGIDVVVANQTIATDGSCLPILGEACVAALVSGFTQVDQSEVGRLQATPECVDAAQYVQITHGQDVYPARSFYNLSPAFNASNPDAHGFYREFNSQYPFEVFINMRFNHSGYGTGFDFATRSALFSYQSAATVPGDYSAFNTALANYNLVFVAELLTDPFVHYSNYSAAWVAAYCFKADKILSNTRSRQTPSGAGRVVHSARFVVVASLVVVLFACL